MATPSVVSRSDDKYLSVTDSVVVYNFHTLFTHDRTTVCAWASPSLGEVPASAGLKSVANLFANAAWLEREVAEMSGISFSGKADLRNLLLPYGDVTGPMRKSFPSTGFREVYYDVTSDVLVQAPNSLQI